MDHERRIPKDVAVAEPLRRALAEWQASVVRSRALDPVTTELVRRRAAAVHDCRACGSLRLVEAVEAEFDDVMTAKIDRYELSDLAERHKVALRVADAVMTQPNDISPELQRQAHQHFTDDELVGLTLDVMKWNYQKVPVALRTDTAMAAGTGLDFDELGNPVIVAAAARTTWPVCG